MSRIKASKPQVINHYRKYKEIHGVDEVIISNKSNHLKEHNINRNSNGRFSNNPNKISIQISKRGSGRVHANKNRLDFNTTLNNRVYLKELIDYYPSTGNVGYTFSIWGRPEIRSCPV